MPRRKIPDAQGFTAPEFQRVFDVFKSSFSHGVLEGASLAVYFKGSLVVQAWGGHADEQSRRPWKEDSYGYFFSGAKFLSAIVIAHLVERGLLKYEEKITKYWPEFGQNGKEDITLTMLLSHQAGLPVTNEDYWLEWMRGDPKRLRTVLEKVSPVWIPGTKHGYAMVLVGLYLDEIVRRVDPKSRSVSQYFHDEVALPFELDLHIGVPRSLFYRTPRLSYREYTQEELTKSMTDFPGDVELYQRSMREPRDWNSRWRINDPDFASLPSPASHAIGTPSSMAKLAGILAMGGVHDGKAMLSTTMIDGLSKPVVHGLDVVHGSSETYGRGTCIVPSRLGDKAWHMFGHTGLGGQCLWVDPLHGVGFAFASNYMHLMTPFKNKRWRPLLEAVYSCIQHGGIERPLRLFESYDEFKDDLKEHPINSRL